MATKIDNLSEEEKKELINKTLRTIDFVEYNCSKCGCFVGDVKVASLRRRQDFRTLCHQCKLDSFYNDKERLKEIREKIKKTNIERYGVENIFSSKEWQEKNRIKRLKDGSYKKANSVLKDTLKEKYGVENICDIPEIKEKYKKTMFERYGVVSPLQNKVSVEKLKKTRYLATYKSMEEKLGNNISIISEEFEGIKKARYFFKCNVCGNEFNSSIDCGKVPECPKCNRPFYKKETEVYDFLYQYIYCEHNRRFTIDEKVLELDIYIPEKNLGVEFNGLYWHSSRKVGKDYHIDKQKAFSKIGIDVVFIFEDEWMFNKEIVKSVLLSRIQKYETVYYARKLELKEVSKKEEKNFFNENHLQGFVGSSYCCGLYCKDELISCMSFGKSRFNKKFEWELLRYANKINCSVVGGAKRIFKKFTIDNNPESLVSYCDNRYFTGFVYSSLGMELIGEAKPNYFYTKRYKRYSRVKFQKHKLKNILETFDEEKTEVENVLNNGYDIIHDCGNKVFAISYLKEKGNGIL